MTETTATEAKGDEITVDLTDVKGVEPYVAHAGSAVFVIRVTWPAETFPPALDGTPQEAAGFGRVVDGPCKGREILYTSASVRR
jgi:hypothetical protein